MEAARVTERQQRQAQEDANWRAMASACIAIARAAGMAKQREYALVKLAEARRYLRRSVPQ